MKMFDKDLENNKKYRSLITGVAALLLMFWLSALYHADSFFSPYVFFAVVAAVAFYENIKKAFKMPEKAKLCIIVFSALFSLATVLANYSIITPLNYKNVISALILLLTGYLIARNILIWTLNRNITAERKKTGERWFYKPWIVFLVAFLFISAVYLLFLFSCSWPGIMTIDSKWQVEQVLKYVPYSNHHPFFHTLIIRACFLLGTALFGDINKAVALYSAFQILCMSGIFAFVIMTLHQAGVSRGWMIVTLLIYALTPYHIIYSITMWKDVLFGGVCLLFICAVFRLIRRIGSERTNYVTLIIGAVGTCLFRSNGYLALLLTFVVMVFTLGKEHRKVLLTILIVLAVTFVMKHGLIKALDISQPDTAEFLSIPEQQIARLIVEEVDLTDDEIAQISKVMDTTQVKSDYLPYISDPVKTIVRNTGLDYLDGHKSEYFMLWLKLACRYPGVYIRAWIDQTKGYWNGGYDYWIASSGIVENPFGIATVPKNDLISKVMNKWCGLFLYNNTFELFRSIGLHVWIIMFVFVVMAVEKRKEAVACVLLLAVVISLLVSTPVFSEFRYAYAIFTSFPFAVLITFAVPGLGYNKHNKDNCIDS